MRKWKTWIVFLTALASAYCISGAQAGTAFWNRSQEVMDNGLNYDGTPLFETALNYDNDQWMDVQIHLVNRTGYMFRGTGLSRGLPSFTNSTLQVFGGTPPFSKSGGADAGRLQQRRVRRCLLPGPRHIGETLREPGRHKLH
jgi:hypothetical protein